MNIHEHQAKDILREFNVSVPNGKVAYTVQEAIQAANQLGGELWVVKSQIHAGGRGAGKFVSQDEGGVRLARSIDEVEKIAKSMLGQVLVTKQTGPEGKTVKRLYIEEGCNIERECYISFLVDRATSQVSIMVSAAGGMDIEEVAEKSPEQILTLPIDPVQGLQGHHGRRIAFFLGLKGGQIKSCLQFLSGMWELFHKKDASMVEINPLVVTKEGTVMALDAKINFDDSSLFRHSDVLALRDVDEEDAAELEASQHDLNYIRLDGEIGCMVNGAGLAMATMDIIQLKGGTPANFLDVGGGATKERVTKAFQIILSDEKVKGILVNIFGGIIHCDMIANGIIEAAKDVNLTRPLVVRLEGTNVEEGKKIIQESSLNVLIADNMEKAAEQIVAAVKGA